MCYLIFISNFECKYIGFEYASFKPYNDLVVGLKLMIKSKILNGVWIKFLTIFMFFYKKNFHGFL